MADNMLTPSAHAETSGGRPGRRLLRPMLLMLGVVLLIILIIGGAKFVQISRLIAQAKAPQPPAVVTAAAARFTNWQPGVSAVGSLKAYRGVDVTTEVGGIVRAISFRSGQDVSTGEALLQLNADTDVAQLRSLEATADLAATVLQRDRAQLKENAISQAQVDADEGDWKSKRAAVEQQRALIAKKAITAPFAGRIGITSINPGQYLNPGDKIATLTTLDPIYVDFNVPQDQSSEIVLGQTVSVSTEGLPGRTFSGKVTATDTKVDQTTRNVTVEATIPNPRQQLLPGMFVRAVVTSGPPERHLTVPQTAVTYNPYGTTVFIATTKKDAQGQSVLIAQQTFIQTGATRGDQVAVLAGLKEGDVVITSGQMKLKNGTPVKIDNSNPPANDPSPTPQEK
ncbi:efflux RND transporter periplasmic adaptor subunit [Burkholderia multivorans]|uniref:efflux RND transporter periplasmic adaptor subunit n=1 Tax=Burkholderia multivorans TaxID=87883 RepID=UPI00345E150D